MTETRTTTVLPAIYGERIPLARRRRIGVFGKGGSSKTTTAAHVLGHWDNAKVPAIGMDADVPGEGEPGSLESWSRMASIGAPVYRAPVSPDDLDRELTRFTPEDGVVLLDTPAWERKPETIHLRALTLMDLVVLCLQPSPGELDRAGSFLRALEHIGAVGGRVPDWVVLLTRTHSTAAAADETREVLEGAGFEVLVNQVPDEHGRTGLGQSHGKPIPVRHDSAMGLVAAELLERATR